MLLLLLALCLAAVMWRAEGRARTLGAAACAVLAVSFVSPLCALSSALFSARTVHHILLVCAIAPLLAWALPRRPRARLALAAAAQTGVFWLWHAPPAYAAAMGSDAVYWLMQLSILASATWFWAAVRAASAPSAVAALLAVMIQMGLLGALITFAGDAVYAPHYASTQAWGLTPLQDQQAAGLIMWAPAAATYLIAALLILGRWLGPEPGPRAHAA